MGNNATLSEDWMGFSDRSSVAKVFISSTKSEIIGKRCVIAA